MNYQYNSKQGISLPVNVGLWNSETDLVTMQRQFYFIGGGTKAPKPDKHLLPINGTVRLVFAVAVAICSLLTIALLIFMYWNRSFKVFRASSPTFLAMYVYCIDLLNPSDQVLFLVQTYLMPEALFQCGSRQCFIAPSILGSSISAFPLFLDHCS